MKSSGPYLAPGSEKPAWILEKPLDSKSSVYTISTTLARAISIGYHGFRVNAIDRIRQFLTMWWPENGPKQQTGG